MVNAVNAKLDVQVFHRGGNATFLISRRNDDRQLAERLGCDRLVLIFFHRPLTSSHSGCCSACLAISSTMSVKRVTQRESQSLAACEESMITHGTSYFRARSSASG